MYPQPQGQSKTVAVASGTSISVGAPDSGVTYKVGDYILFALRSQSSNTTAVSVPSGVSRLGPAFLASNANYRVNGFYGYRVLGDSFGAPVIPSSYAFSLTGSSNSRIVIIAQVFRQVAETPVDSFYNSYFGVTYTKGVDIPAYATNGDGFTVVMAASEFAANNTETPTLQDNDYGVYGQVVAPTAISSGRTSVGLYGREQAKGMSNEFIMTWGTPSGQAAQSITLAGGAWPTTPVTPAPVTGASVELVRNGAIVPAEALYFDGTSLKSADRLLLLPQRVMTVDKWLAKEYGPSYMVHRGGSGDWVEHTRRAVTNAVWLGATNLEMSVWFSTDNVAYCNHDATLTAMTGGAENRRVDQMSSSELDQVTITKAGAGSGEKLMRLSWVIEKYGATHVITVEDKSYAHMAELIALFEYYFPYTANNRFMIKAFGAGGTGHMTLPLSKGYRSWAYFYVKSLGDTSQIPPWDVPEKARLYTTIGIPWNSSQTEYDQAAALGIPLVIHIVPSAAAAATAKERGGSGIGMQIASPLGVIPRINEPLS